MTRQEIEKLLGDGATKDQVDSVLNAMHAQIKAYKDSAEQAGAELAAKTAALNEAAKGATDARDLETKLAALKQQYDTDTRTAAEQLAEVTFSGMLEGAIREHKGRNVKAITALLDVATLRQSKNQRADVLVAVEALAKGEESYLFGQLEAKPTGNKLDVGGRIDKSTSTDSDVAQMRSVMGLGKE